MLWQVFNPILYAASIGKAVPLTLLDVSWEREDVLWRATRDGVTAYE